MPRSLETIVHELNAITCEALESRGMFLHEICDDVLTLPVPSAAFPGVLWSDRGAGGCRPGLARPARPHDGEICRVVRRSAGRVGFAKAYHVHRLDGEPHSKRPDPG